MQHFFADLVQGLADSPLAHWQVPLEQQLQQLATPNDGNLPRFLAALDALPSPPEQPLRADLDAPAVTVGAAGQVDAELLKAGLRALMPWRKGPFNLFGCQIDSEWRCDLKWERVLPHLAPMHGRTVLDVGCGNGYYGWRMLAQGARQVVGIDPSWLSVVQHLAINRYVRHARHHVLPLTLETLTPDLEAFDTVFSMGVLYHRRSPLDHLEELRQALRPGGELVLETLVVDGPEGHALVPQGRYARMNNVWFLPSVPTLELWCRKMGFEEVRCLDLTPTTPEEQRVTDWKPGQSLADYLDPEDPTLTREGHPAPLRATIVAQRPHSGRLQRYHLE
ncbi:MAG: tRNA 5-methoxyuridine(34)/uridine 5-oxyacetic acid(34) synthase CmoB [Natronospirillum sp.]|uniref:tRNA 5-methoxyuridine(34)/uridine 5-oxyacetic acid(34) synthase CmoB n=1 Tax=Natronospirillum sp. TaxID=2812955 RepID=UPI0025EA64ED|nr:tRNA 5-methoxyuridine(34)/uridine 5-oxyacetic acid(34) synthase CmoB [Natronospirillum sp.]MCH8550581.1 tRNA 5-methoxyuridine(34)/uridine 5-oxyacetic acid(34) synthase CmoB [Natronospirillum sp.]